MMGAPHPAPVVEFDEARDTLNFDGFRFSGNFLRQITASPCGVRFAIINRDDGVISIRYERSELEAAAPELVEALRDTLSMLKAAHMHLDMPHDLNKRVVKARSVLAKATAPTA